MVASDSSVSERRPELPFEILLPQRDVFVIYEGNGGEQGGKGSKRRNVKLLSKLAFVAIYLSIHTHIMARGKLSVPDFTDSNPS